MWYEILPSAGIIFAALAIPHYAAYVANKLVLGNVSSLKITSPSTVI